MVGSDERRVFPPHLLQSQLWGLLSSPFRARIWANDESLGGFDTIRSKQGEYFVSTDRMTEGLRRLVFYPPHHVPLPFSAVLPFKVMYAASLLFSQLAGEHGTPTRPGSSTTLSARWSRAWSRLSDALSLPLFGLTAWML